MSCDYQNWDCTFKVFWVYAVSTFLLWLCRAITIYCQQLALPTADTFSFNNMLHVDKDDLSPTTEVWDVDQGLISKLKEQYKKERKGKKGVKSKCRFYYNFCIPIFEKKILQFCFFVYFFLFHKGATNFKLCLLYNWNLFEYDLGCVNWSNWKSFWSVAKDEGKISRVFCFL